MGQPLEHSVAFSDPIRESKFSFFCFSPPFPNPLSALDELIPPVAFPDPLSLHIPPSFILSLSSGLLSRSLHPIFPLLATQRRPQWLPRQLLLVPLCPATPS